jgi:hypothetical protein
MDSKVPPSSAETFGKMGNSTVSMEFEFRQKSPHLPQGKD